jgi:hypothetical protein
MVAIMEYNMDGQFSKDDIAVFINFISNISIYAHMNYRVYVKVHSLATISKNVCDTLKYLISYFPPPLFWYFPG